MKRILEIFTNWRNDVLFALFAIALTLLLSEAETLTSFLISKLIGVIAAYIFCRLFIFWDKQGQIKDLTDIAADDE